MREVVGTTEWEQADGQGEEDVIPAGSMFREVVQSALPYIETVMHTRYRYEGVLIDEERILGLEVRSLPFVSLCIDETICFAD